MPEPDDAIVTLLADYPPMMTVKDVAAALNQRALTINGWLKNGTLPGMKIGKTWRISREQLAEWVANRSNDAPTGPPAGAHATGEH